MGRNPLSWFRTPRRSFIYAFCKCINRARLAGYFPELEDQLCALTWAGYQGAGSPDRADAMVWAMTELFEKRAEPRVRRF